MVGVDRPSMSRDESNRWTGRHAVGGAERAFLTTFQCQDREGS